MGFGPEVFLNFAPWRLGETKSESEKSYFSQRRKGAKV